MSIDDDYEEYHGLETELRLCPKCGEDYEVDNYGNGQCKPCAPKSTDDPLWGLAQSISRLQGLSIARKQAE